MPNGTCSFGRQHKCSICSNQNCKKINHSKQFTPSSAHITSFQLIVGQSSTENFPDEEILNELKQLNSNFTNISQRVSNIEQLHNTLASSPHHNGATPSVADATTLIGFPAIANIQTCTVNTDPHLANKSILWTRIESGGLQLPLPIDSCCSISLVSRAHTDHLLASNSNLKYMPLQDSIPVSVANPKATLHATVPFTFTNGTKITFLMLSVPGLAWPILLGKNHQMSTKALVDHHALTVTFRQPQLNTTIQCEKENPLTPSWHTNISLSASPVTCLLTGMPTADQPHRRIQFRKWLNLVTICVTLTAALLRSSIFGSNLFLQENNPSPHTQVLSGPTSLLEIQSTSRPPVVIRHQNTKCHPSRPIDSSHLDTPQPPSNPQASLYSNDQHNNANSTEDLPITNLSKTFFTTVAIHSDKENLTLPFNANLGCIRSVTDEDTKAFHEAAQTTSAQLSDAWETFIHCHTFQAPLKEHIKTTHPSSFTPKSNSKTWKLAIQQREFQNAGLDSSILSPFREYHKHEHPKHHELPLDFDQDFNPYTEEYDNKLFDSLGLHTEKYKHIHPHIMDNFKTLLRKYPTAFWLPGSPLSIIKGHEHRIETGDASPTYHLPYRKSPSELTAIKTEIQRMLEMNIIEPPSTPWGSPCILVRKPLEQGKPQPPRFVVDYRKLNSVTISDGYPIPPLSNILDNLSSGKYYSKLDLASGYWQIKLRTSDQPKTAFNIHLGLYQFLRLPFGLKTASSTLQRVLNTVFSDYLYKVLIVYMDDVISWASTQEEALNNYELILKRAVDCGVQFKATKCLFFSQSLDILGHHITDKGRSPTTKGIKAITKMPKPQNQTDIKRFLGLTGYFRDYIPNMHERTKHLRNLSRKGIPFQWDSYHEREFNDLKLLIVSLDAMLYHPEWSKPFKIHTDASKRGVGAMLAQQINHELKPVRFVSRAFSEIESRWHTMQMELFAVKWALEQFRPYVLGTKTKIVTDHTNLQKLTSVKPQKSKLAGWCLSMSEFDFYIEHKPGKKHVVPDTLSRLPVTHEGSNFVIMPPDTTNFLAISLSLDVPYHSPTLVQEQFFAPLCFLNLACQTTKPFPLKSFTISENSNFDIFCQSSIQIIPSTQELSDLTDFPKPKDDQLIANTDDSKPLSIDRTQFSDAQRKDPWLNIIHGLTVSA